MSLVAETTTALVLLVVSAAIANGRTVFNYSLDSKLENVEVQNAVENLENIQFALGELGKENDGFTCKGLTCQSCQKIKISKFHVDICMKVTYNPKTGNLTAELTVEKKIIWKEEFPAGKAPTPCIKVKLFHVLEVQFCITFDLKLDSHELKCCVQLKITYPSGSADVDLGCFQLNFVESVQDTRQVFIPLIRVKTMGERRRYEDIEMSKSEEANNIL